MIREVEYESENWLVPAVDLMLRVRAEDAMAGLVEPGDLCWWWARQGMIDSRRVTSWSADGIPLSMIVWSRPKTGAGETPKIDADIVGNVAPGSPARELVWPLMLEALASSRLYPYGEINVVVDGRDAAVIAELERAGFRRDDGVALVQFVQSPVAAPGPRPLPEGWVFRDMTDGLQGIHHLALRNGDDIAWRLQSTRLYDPTLDLRVETEMGEVAAYCLAWRDGATGVGHFEPVRTEDQHAGRGIGKALLTEGIRRLMAGGATVIKVETPGDNDRAIGLYRSVGFERAFDKLRLVRGPREHAPG